MKKNEENTEKLRCRNRDFLREIRRQFVQAYERGETPDVGELSRRANIAGAPEYYISYEQALNYVRRLYYRHKRPDLRRRSDRIALELTYRCRREMNRSKGLKLGDSLSRVLARGEASGYFLSGNYARRLYFRMIESKNEKRTK